MALTVGAPLGGTVISLAEVPDEVFASRMMGPGLAILPDGDATVIDVVAPCAGTLAKVHPHAVALEVGATGILVHLGIDTVTQHGKGFELLVKDGQVVAAGDLLMRWDVRVSREAGHAVESPVVVFEMRDITVTELAVIGEPIAAGAPLLLLAD